MYEIIPQIPNQYSISKFLKDFALPKLKISHITTPKEKTSLSSLARRVDFIHSGAIHFIGISS